ncbi:MAG: M23 family metallopeptidase [Bacteroidota bacterium]
MVIRVVLPVVAPLNGKIVKKGSEPTGKGNHVYVKANKDGKIHRFYHMQDGSTDQVEENQQIERGEQIGRVGTTGHSSGNHLHYEVRGKNESVLNPVTENSALANGSSSDVKVLKTTAEIKEFISNFSSWLKK